MHYFYEGDVMLKRNQFFMALNLSLFTIMGFLAQENKTYLLSIFCFFGAVISFFWTLMTRRANWYIESRVEKIRNIEEQLGYMIMCSFDKKDVAWSAKPSTWILFVFLGYAFVIAWATLFIILILD